MEVLDSSSGEFMMVVQLVIVTAASCFKMLISSLLAAHTHTHCTAFELSVHARASPA